MRADALQNAGHYDKAVLEYSRVLEIDGALAAAHTGRGACLFSQDALDAAQQDFLRAIELDPKDQAAHLGLAALLIERKDYKAALTALLPFIRSVLKHYEDKGQARIARFLLAEAKALGAGMVMAYHPVIFKPVAKLTASAAPVAYAAVGRLLRPEWPRLPWMRRRKSNRAAPPCRDALHR